MKKFLTSIIMGTMIFTSVAFGATVTERSDIELVVNGNIIANENVPIIVNSRTLIPLRDLVTNLGVPDDNEHIVWNGADRTVKISHDNTEINLVIDSDVAKVNGQEVKLDAPAMIYNSRTYVPARFVGEALNKKIGWDNYESKVLVRDMDVYNEVRNVLTKSAEVMKNIKTLKATSDIDMGYEKTGKFMGIKTYTEVDVEKEEAYVNAEVDFMEMTSVSEQYLKKGKYYIKDQSGKWQLAAEGQDFALLLEYTNDFTDIGVKDEIIYDTLSIDNEKTTDEIIVVKNDFNYAGLIQQISATQLQSDVIDQDTREIIDNIKEMNFEYQINKDTGALESLTVHMSIFDKETQDNLELNVVLTVDEFNTKFSVYSPIK